MGDYPYFPPSRPLFGSFGIEAGKPFAGKDLGGGGGEVISFPLPNYAVETTSGIYSSMASKSIASRETPALTSLPCL